MKTLQPFFHSHCSLDVWLKDTLYIGEDLIKSIRFSNVLRRLHWTLSNWSYSKQLRTIELIYVLGKFTIWLYWNKMQRLKVKVHWDCFWEFKGLTLRWFVFGMNLMKIFIPPIFFLFKYFCFPKLTVLQALHWWFI